MRKRICPTDATLHLIVVARILGGRLSPCGTSEAVQEVLEAPDQSCGDVDPAAVASTRGIDVVGAEVAAHRRSHAKPGRRPQDAPETEVSASLRY